MHRPIGVTILALLFGIGGALGLGEGVGLITPPVAVHLAVPSSGPILSVLRILFGTGDLAFAYGAWRLRPWAWTLGIVLLAVNLVVDGLAEGVIRAIAAIPVTMLIVFYLAQAHVREAFGSRHQP